MPDPRDLPPTWAPSGATADARQIWEENPLKRATRLLRPDPQILDHYLPVLLSSFSYSDFRQAIELGYDLMPQIQTKGALDHPILGPMARGVIRIQWVYIFQGLRDPALIREKMRARDPQKASLFDTPSGANYLNWLCYHLLWMLYQRGKIRGEMRVAPPPSSCPMHQGLCVMPSGPQP